jgi:hypothetical protein
VELGVGHDAILSNVCSTMPEKVGTANILRS